MEDNGNLQHCKICSSALTNQSSNNRTALFCDVCESEGRGPPFKSENRDNLRFKAQVDVSSNSPSMLPVSDSDHMTNQRDNGLQNSHNLTDVNCESHNVADVAINSCSSHVQEPNATSNGQELDGDSMGVVQQGSVVRLRKQAEMLANDEDIQVYFEPADEDEQSTRHNQFTDRPEFDSDKTSTDQTSVLSVSCAVSSIGPDNSPVPAEGEASVFDPDSSSPTNSAAVFDASVLLSAAADQASDSKVKRRKRAKTETDVKDRDGRVRETRCDCCSVLSHCRSQIHHADNVMERKLLPVCVGWLLKFLLLLLLLAVLFCIVCSLRPGSCRLGLLVDWRLRHFGGSPPV